MDIIRQLEAEQAAKIEEKRKLPEFQPGDTVRVNVRVTEGTRTRVQAYEGVVIARAGSGFQENFTVRKISYGEGVERVFPVYSPMVEGVEIVRRGKVRRAKLYYLRDRRGKSARISENTGVRARKLNDAERDALNAEKATLEAEKIAAVEALAAEKAAQDAAEKKARRPPGRVSGASSRIRTRRLRPPFSCLERRPDPDVRHVEHEPRNYSADVSAQRKSNSGTAGLSGGLRLASVGRKGKLPVDTRRWQQGRQIRERIMTKLKILAAACWPPSSCRSRPMPRRCPISAAARSSW